MKRCRRCDKEKEIYDYYTHPGMADGHLNICKECVRERARKYSRSQQGREHDKQRNKTKKRKEWLIEYQRKRRKKFPKRNWARGVLNRSVRNGDIDKPEMCEVCNSVKKLEGHHDDYNKTLEVRWLCGGCHRSLHDQLKRIT